MRPDVDVYDALDTPGTLIELARRSGHPAVMVLRVLRAFADLSAVRPLSVDGSVLRTLWYRTDTFTLRAGRRSGGTADPRAETGPRHSA